MGYRPHIYISNSSKSKELSTNLYKNFWLNKEWLILLNGKKVKKLPKRFNINYYSTNELDEEDCFKYDLKEFIFLLKGIKQSIETYFLPDYLKKQKENSQYPYWDENTEKIVFLDFINLILRQIEEEKEIKWEKIYISEW